MKLFITLLFSLLLYIPAEAQSPSKIIKNAEKAMGGKKNLTAVRSWERKGTVTRINDGAVGRFASTTKLPNLFHVAYDLNGFETEIAYNGKSGWTRNSRDGLSTLTGDRSVDFQAEALYRNELWLNYKKNRAKLTSGGTADVNGKRANALLLSTPRGTTIKLYFDAATSLLLKEEIPFGEETVTYEYDDYRPVGAVKQPFAVKMTNGDDAVEVKFESIVPNAPADQARFAFPPNAGEPLPEISVLLAELQQNEDKVEAMLDTYSYVQKSIRRELRKDGILRETGSETYQLSFYKGNRIRRLIEKNGKPLSPREQAEEDKETAKRVEEIEKEIAKAEARNSSGPPSGEGPRISIAEVLRASKLVNPRRERYKGRDVIVFDFEPNPSFDYKNAKSFLKFFGKTAGVMWIDEKDKQVARLEAFLADSFKVGGGLLAKLRKGASFTLEQERVNNEIWLPSTADINLSVRVLLVGGVNVNQVVRSYDYQKFATEVKDASVGEPNKN
ncbi:MAG: hypothetical protein QUS14_08050 [Pyrinomonadaceae bacterium]|nr:hypothetical protein [Pyrinomonadaceae bacterium]